jgi:hypothetical protein
VLLCGLENLSQLELLVTLSLGEEGLDVLDMALVSGESLLCLLDMSSQLADVRCDAGGLMKTLSEANQVKVVRELLWLHGLDRFDFNSVLKHELGSILSIDINLIGVVSIGDGLTFCIDLLLDFLLDFLLNFLLLFDLLLIVGRVSISLV